MFARNVLTAAAAALLWTVGTADVSAQLSSDHVATAPRSLTVVSDAHEQLWIRLNELWSAIQKSHAAAEDRRNFVRFIKFEVLEQLHREGVTIYLAFDSVTAGAGYATIAALYDREWIDRLATELDAEVNSHGVAVFGERSYALAVALQNYFRKTDELVLPVIQAQLTPTAIQTILSRLES